MSLLSHFLCLLLITPAGNDPRVSHRTVLLFSTHANDAMVIKQEAVLDNNMAGLASRDMLVSIVTPASDPDLYRKTMTGNATFAIALFGEDGGRKFISRSVVSSKTLFDIVDGMPMRKEEMKSARGTSSHLQNNPR